MIIKCTCKDCIRWWTCKSIIGPYMMGTCNTLNCDNKCYMCNASKPIKEEKN